MSSWLTSAWTRTDSLNSVTPRRSGLLSHTVVLRVRPERNSEAHQWPAAADGIDRQARVRRSLRVESWIRVRHWSTTFSML